MNQRILAAFGALTIWLAVAPARAQSFEAFFGDEKASIDSMYFRFFTAPPPSRSDSAESVPARSDVLLFVRARGTIDYRMTKTEYLPQFGLTTALSWNPEVLAGFAPVATVQVGQRGVFPKVGVQFVSLSPRATIFTWLVCETLAEPHVDLFVLARYVHPLSRLWGLFFQVESLSAFPTDGESALSFFQRLRAGLQFHRWQFGFGLDTSEIGRGDYELATNIGTFVRADL